MGLIDTLGEHGRKPVQPLYWLRWLFAIPIGLVASLLVMFPVHWGLIFFWFFTGSADSMVSSIGEDGVERGCGLMGLTCFVPIESAERIAQAFVTPAVTLITVSWVFPSHRLYGVGVLAVVYLVLLGSIFTLAAASGGYVGWQWLEFVAALVLGPVGALVGLRYVYYNVEPEAGRTGFQNVSDS